MIEKAAVEEDDLSSALELIDQFEVVLSRNLDSGDLTPDTCTDWLNRIRRVCASLPELPALLAAIARPLLDKLLASWRPLAVGFSSAHSLRPVLHPSISTPFVYF